jgi:ketosteroid isomerase-like protein
MTDFVTSLEAALASRDAAQVASLFAEDYRSMQPAHPGREFEGRAQVLANWTSVFEGVPDFTARLIASASRGETVWSEWAWHGHHVDGSPFAMCGVIVTVLRDGLIAEGRLYMEPVDEAESTIDDAVEDLYQP